MMYGVMLVLLIVTAGVLVSIGVCQPSMIDDSNNFLREFVNHEILNVHGVLVAITLANASQIHLALNRLEEIRGKLYFSEARRELKQNCLILVVVFAASLISLIGKGKLEHGMAHAMINGLNVWMLLLSLLVTWDVARSVFLIVSTGSKALWRRFA